MVQRLIGEYFIYNKPFIFVFTFMNTLLCDHEHPTIVSYAIEYIVLAISLDIDVKFILFTVKFSVHGIHVLIGTTFIVICFLRLLSNNFTNLHHLGFESAAWYWHFVDVVWIFLFVTIYWWGS